MSKTYSLFKLAGHAALLLVSQRPITTEHADALDAISDYELKVIGVSLRNLCATKPEYTAQPGSREDLAIRRIRRAFDLSA